jgi:hypothetical protein
MKKLRREVTIAFAVYAVIAIVVFVAFQVT